MLCATGRPCGPGGHRLPTERLRPARSAVPATQYRYHRSAAAPLVPVLEPVPVPVPEQVRAAEAPGQPSVEAPEQVRAAEAPGQPSVEAAEAEAEDTAPWPQ